MAVASVQTTLMSIISLVVAKQYDLGVPCNCTSRLGSNLLHLHAVADVDQNGEMGKMTEAADARG